MLNKASKKFFVLLLAAVLLVNAEPFDALANTDVLETSNVEVSLNKKEVNVDEEFTLTFKSKDSDSQIQFEVPEGITFLGATEEVEQKDRLITLPGGKDIDVKLISDTEGEYTIPYTDGEKSDDIKISVKSIEVVEQEENTEEEIVDVNNTEEYIDNSTRLVESDGDVSVDFVGYNDSIGLNSTTNYLNMKISFDFKDNTSSNKKLEINLPEGLRYTQIPVSGEYNINNVDTNIIGPFAPNEVISQAIKKIELPTFTGPELPYSNTNGKLVYNFNPTIIKGEISIRIKVDSSLYYGPHIMKESIAINVTKGNN